MDQQAKHPMRRVTLPSGKAIDVVVFEPRLADQAAGSAPAPDLHVCGECESELVYPIDWEEVNPDRWRLELRCPNCSWTGSGVFDLEPVESLDEWMESGTAAIVRDLRRLAYANMEEEIERFVNALRADLILPMDF